MNDENTTGPEPRRAWLVPTLLILLSVVPVGGGAVRLAELTSGAEVTPDNARFFSAPIPVVLHIISVTLFSLLGALQFSRPLRRKKPRWHRAAGRILVPSGLVAAASGLWMEAFYALPVHDGELLSVFRWFFGTAMIVSILLGVLALWRRDFARHGAWMLRGYAIGMGAGTQVLTLGPWYLAVHAHPDPLSRALLMGASWVINLLVAEWVIRRRAPRSRAAGRPPRPKAVFAVRNLTPPRSTEMS